MMVNFCALRGNWQFAGWRRNFALVNCAQPVLQMNHGIENTNTGKSEGGSAAK
jgi:hypothetical protein